MSDEQRFNLTSHDLRVTAPISWEDATADAVFSRIDNAIAVAIDSLAHELKSIHSDLQVSLT